MGQKITRAVGNMHGKVAVFHAHMHMQAKNEVATGGFLQLGNQFIVPHMVGNHLAFPMAEGVRTRSAYR
jgi:hypothetical protein